jgi:dTDP-glucose 4,6-dehydratase
LKAHPADELLVLDSLTYSGNIENLEDLLGNARFEFVNGDIRDKKLVGDLMKKIDAAINFAAESHVDRSLYDADEFISTNIHGAYCLLKAAEENKVGRFIQISTDEVYGTVKEGSSVETDLLLPSSPYAASKASADLMVHSFRVTFDYPAIITRSSNNFGPYQYPEKLIPFFVTNALEDKPLPIYGDGLNVRDWIYVLDNCEAVDRVLHEGRPGETYNIGGGNERTNIEITGSVLESLGKPAELITYVKDRPGHDRRYSLNSEKIRSELGWAPKYGFEEALSETIEWYVKNRPWWGRIKGKKETYQGFMEKHYEKLKR